MAAHIILEEIGAPYELEFVSATGPFEGEMTSTTEWKSVNPKARVPALTGVSGHIGGSANLLTELPAILMYLARTSPAIVLLPEDPAAESRCIEWMNWLSSNVHSMSFAQMWRPQRFTIDELSFPAVRKRGREQIGKQFDYIECLLADGRGWAVPGGYTIVDAYLLVFYYWGQRINLDMITLYPAWTGLTKRILLRPAVRRVIRDEGIETLSNL